MAFSLDRTRSFLRINEPNLLSIHRSTSRIVPTADYCQGHLCDAFICVVREYNLIRVYIGLYDSQLKSNLVFVADPVGADNIKTAILLKEAETFLKNIGFCMELVNMDFSSATREVIMHDMKVMREPSHAVRLDAALLAIEKLTIEKKELIQKASRAHINYKSEVGKLRQQLVIANTAPFQAVVTPVMDEESFAALILERNSLKAEAQTARQEIMVLQDAAMAFEEQAQADNNAVQAVYSEEIRFLRQEIDRYQSEHAVQSNEINILRAALTIADESLSFERAKNESALQEMDALERNAAVELKKLKKKVDSLCVEKHMLESMATEMNIKAKGEIEGLQQINQSQRRAAIKKVKTLKEELRQLSEARAVMSSPIGVALSALDAKSISNCGFMVETRPEITDLARSSVAFSNPFGFTDKLENVCFEPDSTLACIPYAMLDDVVEVHRSFNKIQAAPFGKRVQSCDGFVCVVKDLSQSMSVYVVWFMKETGEVLVCRPDTNPESKDVAINMVREGIGYFERVGFIMDELILLAEPEQRQSQIDSLQFFQKIVIESVSGVKELNGNFY